MIPQITTDDFSLGYSPEKIYFTSDLHLFHTNIIKYCNRPFEYSAEGCTKMNEFILKKFDALPEDCLIWNFGDVFLNLRLGNDRIMQDIMRMKKNRKLCLILGNHDFGARKKPFPNYIEYFKYLGFDAIYKEPLQYGNYVFSHEPVFLEKDSDLVNFHGHTHEKMVSEDYFLNEYNKSFPHKKVNPKQYKNICMDANDFQILK
ncbi:MAG: metallophosphoesterase [Treponema sp.]|nr:metallophosphoesterase [Treponema sp.]